MQKPESQSVAEGRTAMLRDVSTLNRRAFKRLAHPASCCISSCRNYSTAFKHRNLHLRQKVGFADSGKSECL